jgi:hypothetical protein
MLGSCGEVRRVAGLEGKYQGDCRYGKHLYMSLTVLAEMHLSLSALLRCSIVMAS